MNTRQLERLEQAVGEFERGFGSSSYDRQPDGSLDYSDRLGSLEYRRKLYAGKRTFGGTIVVLESGVAVWTMNVFGGHARGSDRDQIQAAAKKVLESRSPRFPFRGPKHYEAEGLIYTNFWEGDMRRGFGQEQFFKGDQEQVYARYAGGLIE